jgi:hypothetical protein
VPPLSLLLGRPARGNFPEIILLLLLKLVNLTTWISTNQNISGDQATGRDLQYTYSTIEKISYVLPMLWYVFQFSFFLLNDFSLHQCGDKHRALDNPNNPNKVTLDRKSK